MNKLNYKQKLKRKIKIKDKYMSLIWNILIDYDGYYDKETKQGSAEGLASLIDETMKYLELAIENNTNEIVYFNSEGVYNILHERLGDYNENELDSN